MRTSAGFCDTGLSGKIRIQMRPPRLMCRVMARRAASIWRAVRRPRPTAFNPHSPKLTLLPRVAMPLLRPFWYLRYLVLAGCSMLRPRSSRFALGFGRRRRRSRLLAFAQDLALEHPHFDTDHTVGGLGF